MFQISRSVICVISASVKSIIFVDKNIFYKKLNYKFAVKKTLSNEIKL